MKKNIITKCPRARFYCYLNFPRFFFFLFQFNGLYVLAHKSEILIIALLIRVPV